MIKEIIENQIYDGYELCCENNKASNPIKMSTNIYSSNRHVYLIKPSISAGSIRKNQDSLYLSGRLFIYSKRAPPEISLDGVPFGVMNMMM